MSIDPAILQSAIGALYYVVFNITKALTVFLQPDSYLYWPFLLSTLLIVLLVSRLSGVTPAVDGSPAATGGWQAFFRWKLWWHRSARADYKIYFANALLLPILLAPLLFSDRTIAGLLDALFGREMMSAGSEPSGFVVRLLFTLVFFVAWDFGRFVAHSLLHDIPALWEFHKIHHSAEVLTPMTSFRLHPLEILIMAWGQVMATGVVTWLFNLAGGGVTAYTFLGLHVVIWGFSLIDNLRHSPVWVSYGPTVGRWLVSPAHHQLHHSIEARHMGCNRGSNLAIWDRLYGTLYVPGYQPEAFRMGLGDGTEAKWNSVWRMYLAPFVACARQVVGALRGRPA
jgi:sterol desaturase/sphingolipid hydroxylase (fatty acid hydroxylase superfamily)